MTDAIIIGGGPGGAVAGMVLAGAGWDVTIVEQHRFPRDKVCGECISDLGLEVLTRLGMLPRLGRFAPAVLRRVVFYGPGPEKLEIDLSRPMWGLSRSVLDTELLAAAADAGAKIVQPGRCEEIEPGSPPRARIRSLTDNTVTTMYSAVVVLADGKPPASVRASLAAPSRLGIKAHVKLDDGPMDRVMLFGVKGHYGGLAAVEGGKWNLSFSVAAEMARQCRGDIDEVMRQLAGQNAALAARWLRARRVGQWVASPLYRHALGDAWPVGVIPVGNAAAAIEPVGGEGMGLAMATAELAAAALVKHGPRLDDAALRQLRREMRDLHSWRAIMCRGIAMLLSRPALAEMAVAAVAANPTLAEAAMRLVKGPARADIM